MSQLSFASIHQKRKTVSTDTFLKEMDRVIPWEKVLNAIRLYYYDGKKGRKPMKLELMLRIYFLQQWFNLGDPSVEDAIYDRISFQKFLKIDVMLDLIPDETTILNFRHLLEEKALTEKILKVVNTLLEKKGVLLKQGTIVDATLISAASSTKNKDKKRDPEMSSTKKNGNWHFGMKMHIGTDAKNGLIHSIEGTTAKVADNLMLGNLLHGKEEAIFGDKGYVSKKDKRLAREAGMCWAVLDKAGSGRKLSARQEKRNRKLSSVRAKVEHPFQVIKHLWGHRKARYKGLKKNCVQFFTLAALHNLYKVRKSLVFG